jgi:hypothetical protein
VREAKKHLLQIGACRARLRRQLGQSAQAQAPSGIEQQQPVADAFGVLQLVDRQHQRALVGHFAQQRHDMQGLAQVEAIEGLVEDQDGLRREQCQRQQQPRR